MEVSTWLDISFRQQRSQDLLEESRLKAILLLLGRNFYGTDGTLNESISNMPLDQNVCGGAGLYARSNKSNTVGLVAGCISRHAEDVNHITPCGRSGSSRFLRSLKRVLGSLAFRIWVVPGVAGELIRACVEF